MEPIVYIHSKLMELTDSLLNLQNCICGVQMLVWFYSLPLSLRRDAICANNLSWWYNLVQQSVHYKSKHHKSIPIIYSPRQNFGMWFCLGVVAVPIATYYIMKRSWTTTINNPFPFRPQGQEVTRNQVIANKK